jgi:hypothetical protein
MAYERLEAGAVLATAQRLQGRIQARFPDRNLSRVATQLVTVAGDLEASTARTLPIRIVRVVGLVLIAVLFVLAAASVLWVGIELISNGSDAVDWMSTVSTVISNLVYVGLAVIFLRVAPSQLERRRILGELHRLRSLAHVIDMHQLTKDPERFAETYRPTPNSVNVGLSAIDMATYLDYCSELLALVAKTAAVYAERTTDPAVLATISDIENLTNGMARKIWQKLGLLPGIGGGSVNPAS